MAWTYGGERIYATEMSAGDKQIIARLQPLGGATVHQVFGYENEIVKLRAYVVGDTILAALKAMAKDGVTHSLVGNTITYGSYYLANFSWSRVPAVWQTLTAVCDDPLYQVELELYI
jgi:hypothetical protein